MRPAEERCRSSFSFGFVRTPDMIELWKKSYLGYPWLGREDRMTYYYRQVFLGVVRAVDYLVARPDWNHKALITTGGSQGGGLALIAAGLDKRVTAVISIVPALGEHTGPLFGRPDAAPRDLIFDPSSGPNKRPSDKIIAATAYYDTCNFARFIKVPVVMSIGLLDTAVPPMTSLSIYNLLTGLKSLDLDPLVGHNQGRKFSNMRNRFYQEQAGIADPTGKATTPLNIGAPIVR